MTRGSREEVDGLAVELRQAGAAQVTTFHDTGCGN